MTKISDISYGIDAKQKIDLYLQDFSAPLVFYVHGGGWWQGDKEKDLKVFQALFQAGFSVASTNYRLADEKHPYPTQLDDTRSALTFLINSDYQFNKKKYLTVWCFIGRKYQHFFIDRNRISNCFLVWPIRFQRISSYAYGNCWSQSS